MTCRLFGVLLLFFSPAAAFPAETMFEGYYRVELEGQPIGYNIQRFDFDPKTKMFDHTSFLRVKLDGKVVQESLKARANDKFQPVSYQYTAQVGEALKTIDATFKGENMKLVISDGGKSNKVRTEEYKLPKGTFLSSYLTLILLQKKALKVNEAFKYSAVAEEEGNSYWGKTWIESKSEKGAFAEFRVVNSFNNDKFISLVAAVPEPGNSERYVRGEMVSTSSPAKNLTSRLVASPSLATEGQLVPNKVILTLFGTMPTGKLNLIADPPPKLIAAPVPPAAKAPEKSKEN